MELMQLKAGACKRAQLPLQSSTSQSLACEQADDKKEIEEARPRRTLKVEISDVSLDSQGFPLMLSSPQKKKARTNWHPRALQFWKRQGSVKDRLCKRQQRSLQGCKA